jgi:hypothetical protein
MKSLRFVVMVLFLGLSMMSFTHVGHADDGDGGPQGGAGAGKNPGDGGGPTGGAGAGKGPGNGGGGAPEPASMLLLAAGAGVVGNKIRKRSKTKSSETNV